MSSGSHSFPPDGLDGPYWQTPPSSPRKSSPKKQLLNRPRQSNSPKSPSYSRQAHKKPVEMDTWNKRIDPVPCLIAEAGNQREVLLQSPEILRSAVLSATGNAWSIDVEQSELRGLPLSLANLPLIPEVGNRVSVYSIVPDPLPRITEEEDILKIVSEQSAELTSFMNRYQFEDILFLLTGTALLLYSGDRDLARDREHLPQTIGGFVVTAVVGKLQQTSPRYNVGMQVDVVGASIPASFGVTVRQNSTGTLYNTYPSHISHYVWRRIHSWWWRILKAWVGYGVGDWSDLEDVNGTRYQPSKTLDTSLQPHKPFPYDFTADITLAKTNHPLAHPNVSLALPQNINSSPPAGLYQLLHNNIDPSCFQIETIPKVWNRRIGVAVHGRQPDIHTDHLIISNLWRGVPIGAADGDAQKSLAGYSGSPLARQIGENHFEVIGFQSYQLLVANKNPSSGLSSLFDDLCSVRTGFYGTFVLPEELVQNYTIV